MSSKNNNKLPAWDLSDMYKGIDDPKIGADLEKFRKNALSFARKYKGKLAGLTAAEFLSALKAEEKMSVPVRLGYACMKKPRRAWSLRLTAGNTTTLKSASCC